MASGKGPSHGDFAPTQSPPPGQYSRANRRRLSGPGLRTLLAIAEVWGLRDEDCRSLLGKPSRPTYSTWVKSAREGQEFTLTVDALTRISMVLGIHQSLVVLYGNQQEQLSWLRTPHHAAVFNGLAPMDLVLSGTQDSLLSVRRFLDAARGGLYMQPNEVDEAFRQYQDSDVVCLNKPILS